jgi:metallophosphoesterase superfamily enzyme
MGTRELGCIFTQARKSWAVVIGNHDKYLTIVSAQSVRLGKVEMKYYVKSYKYFSVK